jgi:hypothetical protein
MEPPTGLRTRIVNACQAHEDAHGNEWRHCGRVSLDTGSFVKFDGSVRM